MWSAKIIMTLWVIWKKLVELLIDLDPEDLEDAQDIGVNAGDEGRPAPLWAQALRKVMRR